MKQILIFIGLASSLASTGQPLIYKGDFVDTVQIISNSSYYHFDSRGTTTGIYDEYTMIFNKDKNNYILDPYQRTKYKITHRPDTSFTKTRRLKQGDLMDRLLLAELLKQLEISHKKPTFDKTGMTNEEFLKLTDKKYILKVAKWHKKDRYFTKAYSTKEQNEAVFKGCQNIDTLNLYLATAFDTSGYVVVSDVDNSCEIIISTISADYRFEGKYPNPFKQPWYNHSDPGHSIPTNVLNFSINSALIAILPSNFSGRETLKFEALTNEYIIWYLKRRGIII